MADEPQSLITILAFPYNIQYFRKIMTAKLLVHFANLFNRYNEFIYYHNDILSTDVTMFLPDRFATHYRCGRH